MSGARSRWSTVGRLVVPLVAVSFLIAACGSSSTGTAPGRTTGQRSDGTWWVVGVDGEPIKS